MALGLRREVAVARACCLPRSPAATAKAVAASAASAASAVSAASVYRHIILIFIISY